MNLLVKGVDDEGVDDDHQEKGANHKAIKMNLQKWSQIIIVLRIKVYYNSFSLKRFTMKYVKSASEPQLVGSQPRIRVLIIGYEYEWDFWLICQSWPSIRTGRAVHADDDDGVVDDDDDDVNP